MAEELKPCPFCGCKSPIVQHMEDGGYAVFCGSEECLASLGDCTWGDYHIGVGSNLGGFDGPDEAIAAWNRREGESDA